MWFSCWDEACLLSPFEFQVMCWKYYWMPLGQRFWTMIKKLLSRLLIWWISCPQYLVRYFFYHSIQGCENDLCNWPSHKEKLNALFVLLFYQKGWTRGVGIQTITTWESYLLQMLLQRSTHFTGNNSHRQRYFCLFVSLQLILSRNEVSVWSLSGTIQLWCNRRDWFTGRNPKASDRIFWWFTWKGSAERKPSHTLRTGIKTEASLVRLRG